MTKTVAIDGPAGAGKSSIARRAAKALGFMYVDTGALYRAMAFHALESGVPPDAEEAVEALLPGLSVELRFLEGEQHVFVNGVDVSEHIRTPEISMGASAISALPCARAFLLELQRGFARQFDVIMDGRDIGTVVLPHATLKVFLTASPEERAMRRFLQLEERVPYEEILADIRTRDHNDATRAIAPLKQAEDAVLVDTTGQTLEESVEQLTTLIRESLGGGAHVL